MYRYDPDVYYNSPYMTREDEGEWCRYTDAMDEITDLTEMNRELERELSQVKQELLEQYNG